MQRTQEYERCREALRIAEQGAELGATGENKVKTCLIPSCSKNWYCPMKIELTPVAKKRYQKLIANALIPIG